jgi:hypothetical protein
MAQNPQAFRKIFEAYEYIESLFEDEHGPGLKDNCQKQTLYILVRKVKVELLLEFREYISPFSSLNSSIS